MAMLPFLWNTVHATEPSFPHVAVPARCQMYSLKGQRSMPWNKHMTEMVLAVGAHIEVRDSRGSRPADSTR